MLHRLRLFRLAILLTATLVFGVLTGIQDAHAQSFMSPYEPDSNTVLLLHFDGNFENDTPLDVPDGQNHGDSYRYLTSNIGSEFGQMLRLDNTSPSDTTGVLVPDHDALDLTGDWTIEAWVNVLTFGNTNDDWRWRPRFVIKPHAEQGPHHFNYNLLARGDFRSLRGNYRANLDSIADDFGWLDTDTSPGSFEASTWYHLTFIRDSEQHLTGLLIHDINGDLVEFASRDYDPDFFAPPSTTAGPVNIGMTKMPDGSFQNAFVDGFLDEIRISNVIRNFETAPIISNVTNLTNVSPQTAAEVTATAKIIPGSQIDQITLNYNAGNGWQSVPMSANDSLYTGSIPSQPAGTAVEYYVSGTAQNGLSSAAPSGVNPDQGPYLNYAVQDTGQILHLDFEDETMPPVNKGNAAADLNWTVGGEPQIVDDGANGTAHAMYLEGDSSHLSIGPDSGEPDYSRDVDAAFLKNDDFVLDFWVKADSALPPFSVRWVIKEGQQRGVYEQWNEFNYQVWTTGGGSVIPASYFREGSNVPGNVYTGNLTSFDSTITADQWYRVVNVLQSNDTVYTQLYDANNELIDEQGSVLNFPVFQSNGPFRIGAFSPALEDLEVPFGVPDGPLFRGYIDELKFYNYVPEEYQTPTSIDEPVDIPQQVTLGKNYPNPFNPTTKINYQLPEASDVTLTVYDVLGREVARLVDSEQQAGSYSVTFSGDQLSSGVYFYRLSTENVKKVRKMMLIK